MSQNQRPSTKIQKFDLKYDKRRYDGGTEISLIQYIEAKRLAAEKAKMARAYNASGNTAAAAQPGAATAQTAQTVGAQPGVTPVQNPMTSGLGNPATTPAGKVSKARGLGHILLVGPLELTVSFAGILTSVLALAAFSFYKNEPLRQQSHMILKESLKMIKKGVKDCALAPWRGVKHLVLPDNTNTKG